MIPAVMFVAAGALGVVVLFIVVPRASHRGLAAALALLVVAATASTTAPAAFLAPTPLAVTALMLTGAVLGERRDIRRAVPVLVLMVVSAAITLVTTASLFPQGTALSARLSVAGLATVICVAGFRSGDRRILVVALVTVAAAEAVLGVLEFFVTHQPIPWGFKTNSSGKVTMLRNSLLPGVHVRVSGSIGHPIPYALVVAAGLICLCLDWRRTNVVLRVVLVPLLASALVLSSSRSVIIALGLALLHVLWTGRPRYLPVRLVLLALGGVLGALALGDAVSSAADRFLSSGSYENRANSIAAVPGLLARAPAEALFGSGFGTDDLLFDRGFFVDLGLHVIDNQVVTSLATQGIVGAVLLVATFVVAWVTASRSGRALVIAFAVMTFSFDFMAWLSMIVLLGIAFVLPDADDRNETRAGSDAAGIRRPRRVDQHARGSTLTRLRS